MVSLQDLIKARVHFGHRTSRWCPKMAPYIWGAKNDIHLIDIAKTAALLERAARFLESVALQGKPILWVGTKKSAQACVKSVSEELNEPYVTHRWIGGTLTNYPQVKKSVTKLLHLEDVIKKADQFSYTKKEINRFQKNVGRLQANVGGISAMQWPVAALVVVDIRKEHAAVREAFRAGIPVIALVDTNSDPTGIDYIIPANDDAVSSVTFIMDYLKNAVARGQEQAKENKKAEQEESAKAKAAEKAEKAAKKADEPAKAKAVAKKKPAAKAKAPAASPAKKTEKSKEATKDKE